MGCSEEGGVDGGVVVSGKSLKWADTKAGGP